MLFSFNNIDDIKKFVAKNRPDGAIVDTNILILFLVGNYDSTKIGECGLLDEYCIEDFETLKEIFKVFKKIIITPHIIAELSNLSVTGKRLKIYGDGLISYLQTVVEFLKLVEERYQKLDCLWGMNLEILSEFGFTDMTIFELSNKTKTPVITNDSPFCYRFREKIPIIRLEDIKNGKYQSAFR